MDEHEQGGTIGRERHGAGAGPSGNGGVGLTGRHLKAQEPGHAGGDGDRPGDSGAEHKWFAANAARKLHPFPIGRNRSEVVQNFDQAR
jgi:hypothetical protein